VREIQERLRRQLSQAMVDAARAEGLSLNVNGIAFDFDSELSVVSAPVAGLETLEANSTLDGRDGLVGQPVMFWYLAGESLDDENVPLSEGFYTVLANQERGTVTLRNSNGNKVAEGRLKACIRPSPPPWPGVAFFSATAHITTLEGNVKHGHGHIKVCGDASVSAFGGSVSIEGCIEVDF